MLVETCTKHHPEVLLRTAAGKLVRIPGCEKTVSLRQMEQDHKKTYGHYVLEGGLTFMYFLELCKRPDRQRLLRLFKLMMMQLKGRTTHAKYPLEILMMLFQQLSILSERRAHQVLHGSFVNTKGRPDTNVPADLQMEWLVKHNKRHIKHMFSNKSTSNIYTKSSALPGFYAISRNFDNDADVLIRSKRHNHKEVERDELQMMDDLRKVRPFEYQAGRSYLPRLFKRLKVSQTKNLTYKKLKKWFDTHKDKHINRLEG